MGKKDKAKKPAKIALKRKSVAALSEDTLAKAGGGMYALTNECWSADCSSDNHCSLSFTRNHNQQLRVR